MKKSLPLLAMLAACSLFVGGCSGDFALSTGHKADSRGAESQGADSDVVNPSSVAQHTAPAVAPGDGGASTSNANSADATVVVGDEAMSDEERSQLAEKRNNSTIKFLTIEPNQPFVIRGKESEIHGVMPGDKYAKIIGEIPADIRTSDIDSQGLKNTYSNVVAYISHFDESIMRGRSVDEFIRYFSEDRRKQYIETEILETRTILGQEAPGLMQYEEFEGGLMVRHFTYFVTFEDDVYAIGGDLIDQSSEDPEPIFNILDDMGLSGHVSASRAL